MKCLFIIKENLTNEFIMKSLTFFNFNNSLIEVFNNNKYLNLLKIKYKEIDKIENYNKYDLIICNYNDYIKIKSNYNNKFIFYYQKELINNLIDYKNTNICLDNSNFDSHLSYNFLFNVSDNNYYYLKDKKLYLIKNKCKNKDFLYVNNIFIKKFKKSFEDFKIDNIKINYNQDEFPYKIIKNGQRYYKKYNNYIQEININQLKEDMNNIIDFINISEEDISNCQNDENIELHFTILILSYNNEKYTDLCLNSALKQNYKNFNVIFINCNSNDDTRNICNKYTNLYDNITIIDETDRIFQTENFLLGTLLADENTTIVSLDGDDWLDNNNILKLLNNVYFSTRCLMTYGSYIEFPYRNVRWGWKKRSFNELKNIRKNKFSLSHLRTWNKKLFLNIKDKSLKMNENFPEMSGDVSVLLYLVEMFPEKCIFINKILYQYNRTNVLSDSNVNQTKQINTADYFFKKKKYNKKSINEIFSLKNSLLYFIDKIYFSELKLSMIERYLKYDKSRFKCTHSCKIFKNTSYQTNIYYNYPNKNHSIEAYCPKYINPDNAKKFNLFLSEEKLKNYRNLMENTLYDKYCLKKDNKLGIIILSCKKYLHKAIKKIQDFKKSNINAICKIFIGDDNFENDHQINDIVYLKISDNYESLIMKVHRAINWFIKNYDIDYIFKTDDDININFIKLYDIFKNEISNKILYCGNTVMFTPFKDTWHFNKCQDSKFNKKVINVNQYGVYCSGGGYFVHKNILLKCLDNFLNIRLKEGILAEDLAMGMSINRLDILPCHIPYFKLNILNWNEPTHSYFYFYYIRQIFQKIKITDLKLINFIPIPENGRLKLNDKKYDILKKVNIILHDHNYSQESKKLFNQMIILRDPIDRFISAVNCALTDWSHEPQIKNLIKKGFDTPNKWVKIWSNPNHKEYSTLMKEILNKNHKVGNKLIKYKWTYSPQSLWIDKPKFIFLYDNIENDFHYFTNLHKIKNLQKYGFKTTKTEHNLSKKSLNFLNKFYSKDISFYNKYKNLSIEKRLNV